MNNKRNDNNISLESLPSDILYVILSYCDNKCLSSLSCCSKKFYYLLKNDDYVWFKKSLKALVTNQRSKQIQFRSSRVLSARDKCVISSNWTKAIYTEHVLVKHKLRYMPWIWLEKHFLWFTKGDILLKYRRNSKTGYICGHQSIKVCTKHEDICRFVIKNDLIISGGRKGSIDVWDKYKGKVVVTQNKAHSCDVNSVDSTLNNVVISGSKDTYVKLWSLHNNGLKCLKTISVKDRIWTLAVNDIKQQFIVGSAGCGPNKSLLLYDIEGAQLLSEFGNNQRGAGILHSIWESDNQVLSCGYDSCVRLWDTRSTQNCVMKCEDPHDSAVYSIASDHLMTILSGTARYGLTRLWDKRSPKRCIQMYYTGKTNSPVYSLSFDPLCAYVALQSSINLLNFS